ncbi:MAG: sorbosone dehydrogenase family protein, partial [Gemmatimonadetes bacterium]|nr:sorbosone dehydrogenase family protein [Gemmatimonadota bacterium]
MARPFRPISVARIASAVIVVLGAVALYWKVTGRQQLDKITLPNGFSIAIYSGAVPNARQMALGDNGTVFVGSMLEGNVYALVDGDGDNVAEETYTIASDLTLPSGVTFQDGALYVAALNRILVYDGIESRLANPPQPVVIRDDLPTLTHHGWKFIQFGPDGLLYLAVGMPCNICPESDG